MVFEIHSLTTLCVKCASCALGLFPYSGVKVKVAQSCQILRNPVDLLHGILQARILEWVAFPFSRGYSQPSDRTQVSDIAARFFTS